LTLVQAAISGVLLGGLYAVMAVGVTVSWGMLRIISLSHFGLILLGAYLTFDISTTWRIDPVLTLFITVPVLFAAGALLQWLYQRARLGEFASLLVSFGVLVIIIQSVHNRWTADFQRMPPDVNWYGAYSVSLGGGLVLPVPTLVAAAFAVVIVIGAWIGLRTTFAGRALRAFAEDREMAAAYGIDHSRLGVLLAGAAGATAAVAGMLWAINRTLVPDAPYEWIGLVFAVVILGGIGHLPGTLGAGALVGLLYGLTAVVWSNTAALLVVFCVIVLALLFRPHGLLVRKRAG
jgi:branched-chain amino acid transport system permease protein